MLITSLHRLAFSTTDILRPQQETHNSSLIYPALTSYTKAIQSASHQLKSKVNKPQTVKREPLLRELLLCSTMKPSILRQAQFITSMMAAFTFLFRSENVKGILTEGLAWFPGTPK